MDSLSPSTVRITVLAILTSVLVPISTVSHQALGTIPIAQSAVPSREIQRQTAIQLAREGQQRYRQGQLREALALYEQALAIIQEIGDRQGEGVLLSNTGELYRSLGQPEKALERFQQSLTIRREIGDRHGEAITLINLGAMAANLGQFQNAQETYQQALNLMRELGDREGEGVLLNNLGSLYDNAGDYPKALALYQQALQIRREVGDRRAEGITLSNIGLTYYRLGQDQQAESAYQQALGLAREIGDRRSETIVLNNLGGLYEQQGRYAQALQLYQQAADQLLVIGDRRLTSRALNNVGLMYFNLGQYEKAAQVYQQALDLAQATGDRASEAIVLHNIGQVFARVGGYERALDYYRQALTLQQELGNRDAQGQVLLGLGITYRLLKQDDRALETYQQALALNRETGNRRAEATALNNIGFVYQRQGNPQAALPYYRQALEIRQQSADRVGESITLSNLGGALLDLQQYPEAEDALMQAIVAQESLRPGLTDQDKVSLFETQKITYELLQATLVAQGKVETALEISERGRARAFVELLAARQSDDSQLQAALQVKPPTIAEIRQIAKTQAATLVEYSVVDDHRLLIWVIKPSGEIIFEQVDLTNLPVVDDRSPLETLVQASRVQDLEVQGRSISFTENPDLTRQAFAQIQPAEAGKNLQKLHEILIAPIVPHLPSDPEARVVIIPQGSLFLVPFAALPGQNGTPLIARHTLVMAPAIQVLAFTHQRRQTLPTADPIQTGDLLVIGNPTMPQIGDPPRALASLPGAEQEARAIAALFGQMPLIGDQARKAEVIQKMQAARIVHLATHGLLDDYRGLGVPGAIALAPDLKPVEPGEINGLLTASEILDLRLQAELVVLSACDTGRGRITGDGVIGLSRSLLLAGTPSVVVSLWKVPDDATSELMQGFYAQLKQGKPKAAALRQAMLDLRSQYPDPKDWSGFILIGQAE